MGPERTARRGIRSLVTTFLCLVIATHLQAAPFGMEGRAVPFYAGEPQSPLQQKLIPDIKQRRLAEHMADFINQTLRLQRDVGVGFASCGKPNAFFNASRSSIVFCWELLDLIVTLARGDAAVKADGPKEFGLVINGAVWGILLHELGHALIATNEVAVTGREEDVADQFAFFLGSQIFEKHGIPVIEPTVWLFTRMSKRLDAELEDHAAIRRLMADEHSLDQQRVFNVACWALGADAGRFVQIAAAVELTMERAARCGAEFAGIERAFRAHFQRYLKVKLPER